MILQLAVETALEGALELVLEVLQVVEAVPAVQLQVLPVEL